DIPLDAALGTVPISYAVSGSNASGELGAGSNKPFAFDVEAIARASLEAITAFDGVLSADPAHPARISMSVRNTGSAATLAPPTVRVDVPDGTRLGSGYATDAW